MSHSFFFFTWKIALIAVVLCISAIVLMEVGRQIGLRRLARDTGKSRVGVGAVEGAVFGLLGLLLAFSFSGAASRFDARRQMIVEETNAISTAYMRLDLLSSDKSEPLRELFRKYVDARLSIYGKLPDMEAATVELHKATDIQNEIWRNAVVAAREEDYQPAAMLLLPALNTMNDIASSRSIAAQVHSPVIIFMMLGALLLMCSLLAGVSMAGGRKQSWTHVLGFAVMLAATMYVILDLEYPRFGLIRFEAFDKSLVELRQAMN